MKKNVSLKELNANGQLIFEFKQVSFVCKPDRRPVLYKRNNSTTCYLHYYNDEYYVTDYVLYTRQSVFDDFHEALSCFHAFVANICF